MRVLVTGAAGFLGSRLVERLATMGHDITAIGRGPIPDQFISSKSVVWIKRDIAHDGLDPDEIAGIDTVFHLAGATLGAGHDEWHFLMANEATTVRLLQACAKHVKKFIFASSQVVYGDVNHTAVTEDFPLQGVGSAYACSKLNSENWLRCFQKKHGGLYMALRFSGFVEGGGAIDYIIDQALRNKPVELFSRGTVHRDYLPVEEGVEAFLAALRYEGVAGFETFNIGSGQAITSFELAKLICTEMGSSSEIILSPLPAPQSNFVFDIRKASQCLEFNPEDLLKAVRDYLHRKKATFERGGRDA